jgi:hypothetical protein
MLVSPGGLKHHGQPFEPAAETSVGVRGFEPQTSRTRTVRSSHPVDYWRSQAVVVVKVNLRDVQVSFHHVECCVTENLL